MIIVLNPGAHKIVFKASSKHVLEFHLTLYKHRMLQINLMDVSTDMREPNKPSDFTSDA